MTIIHTAMNFRCDSRTSTLGEAYPVIKIADDAQREFEKCLELLRSSENEDVRRSAQSAFEALGDLRHNASWATLVSESKDAAAVAMVRPVRRNDEGEGVCKGT